MELQPPPDTRPSVHALRAHLAHGLHHGLLDEESERRLREAVSSIGDHEPPPRSTPKRSRRRRAA